MKLVLVWAVLVIMLVIGEIRCIVKAFQCNWEPIGKAEIMYTVGACSGLGGIIGWFNIEDK